MRRKNIQTDSLELFLDTICNTFGGILFIALLVIILLQITGKTKLESSSRETVDEIDYIQIQNDYERLKDEWEHLSEQIKQIGEIDHLYGRDSIKVVLEKEKELQNHYQQIMQEKDDLLKKSLKATKETGLITQTLITLKDQCKDEEKEKKKKEKTLEEEENKKVRKRSLPQMRPSHKMEIGVILRFNRFYLWHRYNQFERIGLNTEDFLILSEDDQRRKTLPNILKGIPLDQGNPHMEIVQKLSPFSTSKHKLTVIIWPDSYGSWKTVQDIIGKLGFDYTPVPTYNGCVWMDRGGQGRDVQ